MFEIFLVDILCDIHLHITQQRSTTIYTSYLNVFGEPEAVSVSHNVSKRGCRNDKGAISVIAKNRRPKVNSSNFSQYLCTYAPKYFQSKIFWINERSVGKKKRVDEQMVHAQSSVQSDSKICFIISKSFERKESSEELKFYQLNSINVVQMLVT